MTTSNKNNAAFAYSNQDSFGHHKPMKPTKPRGLNHSSVQDLIQAINSTYNCPVRELESLINLALSPLVGGEPSCVGEMSLAQIKEKIAMAWGQSSYAELQKDKEWRLYHKSTKMNGRLRETWLVYYREWVKLPDDELNLSDGNNVVNGINIFQNFRPWEVFALDKKTASADDVKKAFRMLSIKFHPDTSSNGGNIQVLNKLIDMRDSLLLSF